jgi:hypothetical protein
MSRAGCYARRKWRLQVLLIIFKYSTVADLHNLQFTFAQALGFSVSTSRLLATDLNTETITIETITIKSSCLLRTSRGYLPPRTQN